MFILTSLTLPLAALTAFSSTGPSCLHGPHHGAQKSTKTGWRLDSSMTSLTKACVVVSLTTASAVTVPACCNMFPCPKTPNYDPARPESVLFDRINGEKSHDCNHGFSPSMGPAMTSIRGGWPVPSRNLSNPSREIVVVAVFTRG